MLSHKGYRVGFHDLETVFYPLALRDALEVIHTDNNKITGSPLPLLFSESGLPVRGNQRDNLCVKAYLLIKRDHPELPPIQMHLHKAISTGAGLGGGSADGAFMLTLLI